jgi:hypothetical protein
VRTAFLLSVSLAGACTAFGSSDSGTPIADSGTPTADSGTPAGDSGTPTTTISVVQSSVMDSGNGVATVAPTKPGSLIAVVVISNAVEGISITDNAPGGSNQYTPTGQFVVAPNDAGVCSSGEVWYAKDARPGVTSVVPNATGNIVGWVLEVSGVSSSSVPVHQELSSQTTPMAAAPKVASPQGAFVLSTLATCGGVPTIQPGDPFTPLFIQNGSDAAYYVTPTSGSYGASWTGVTGQWGAMTVAF